MNIQKLSTAECVRVVNSTPLGAVATRFKMQSLVDSAGHRVLRGDKIDLIKLAGWLHRTYHERRRQQNASSVQHRQIDKNREQAAIRRAASQDVATEFSTELLTGPLDDARRNAGTTSLRSFCSNYGPKAFFLSWSPSHLRAIELMEAAVHRGEMFAFAMPRGSGKTTLSRWGVIWAVLTGKSPYAVLIGATMASAERQLKNIKTELRFNDLLFADFPEVCAPIRHLRGEARRASGQKHQGIPTLIEWNKNQIVLATIPGCKASGAIIDVTGIEGDIRGRQFSRSDGTVVRPTLVICDDPQTRDSARSPSQSEQREAILAGDIKYMAGPDRPLGVVMPCTVIAQNDMADRMLDRKLHPEWQGEKTRMVNSFPSREDLWEEYAKIREESFLSGNQGEEATAYYADHRADMDAGSEVSWPDRHFPSELSAIQHAMNLRGLDEAAFYAEYQNEPLTGQENELTIVTADDIAAKAINIPRGKLPAETTHLTAMIDVSQKVLWWTVVAWRADFTGHIVDYGIYPKQNRQYVTLPSVKVSMQMKSPGKSFEAALLAGLTTLTNDLLGREWRTEARQIAKVDLCLIDANWGQHTNVVVQFCRRSNYANILRPSHGIGITASRKPLNDPETRPKQGERRGLHWRMVRGKDGMRRVHYDTNFWKSFVFNRWAVPIGDSGSLTMFTGSAASVHRMFIEQATAEYCVQTEGRGRTVDQWEIRPGRDNHFLDCLVGCAVGASIQGVSTGEQIDVSTKRRAKVKLSDVYKTKKRQIEAAASR